MYAKTNKGIIYIPDISEKETTITAEEYPAYVSMKIHERYSVDDEIAIIRQKDEKPEEYREYYEYCEYSKAFVKQKKEEYADGCD